MTRSKRRWIYLVLVSIWCGTCFADMADMSSVLLSVVENKKLFMTRSKRCWIYLVLVSTWCGTCFADMADMSSVLLSVIKNKKLSMSPVECHWKLYFADVAYTSSTSLIKKKNVRPFFIFHGIIWANLCNIIFFFRKCNIILNCALKY